MASIGAGEWDSAVLQDRRWRKRLERLDDRSVADRERVRLARKVLRDGNDLAVCLLFHTFRTEDAGTAEHALRAVLGPMRVRARRILARPSRLRGRDHREAAAILRHAPQPRDLDLLLARLAEPQPPETRADLLAALTGLGQLPPDAPLVAFLRAAVAGEDGHARLAAFLATWAPPVAVTLLRDAVAHHEGHAARWPYLDALFTRVPSARPLVVAHRDSLPLGDPRRAAVDARLA